MFMMAWIRVESSVRTHAKFLKAGPDASWLWLCGMGYCQEGMTDGFIPEAALIYLGVAKPEPLMRKLVAARLWDVAPGGWQVHDYLEHNRDASEIRRIQGERRAGGYKGGRPPIEKPSGKPSRLSTEEPSRLTIEANLPGNPSTSTSTTTATTTARTSTSPAPSAHGAPPDEGRYDVAFLAFQTAYPAVRRKGGFLVQQSFIQQIALAGGVDRLIAALANHMDSEQWSNPRMIPGMDTWLSEERWRQELPPANAASASASNPKTAGNVAALNRFIERGRPGA